MNPPAAVLGFAVEAVGVAIAILAILLLGTVTILKMFRKVEQGTALIRSGMQPKRVTFTGMIIVPIMHKAELMDIKVKRIEISRIGKDGLVCKDNVRADIKVAFFIRVNDNEQDVLRVATSIGCDRASEEREIQALFDAKFSEGLKTVGKNFDFTQLYEERDRFKDEILKVIGTDLNGFVLDDCAIDYLEQTPLELLNPNNILDAEGIKKITDITAAQEKLANEIRRDKERVIKKQDVETREAILELERQQAEAEAKQQREIAVAQAREEAEAEKVRQEQRLHSERARIATEEEVFVSEQNMERSVVVAQRNKERTDGVELERVERDRQLEAIDRERQTQLRSIESEKEVETQRRDIQEVIRERVAVEKAVVEEQERIKDTEATAAADREKTVAITLAEKDAEEELVRTIKEAEAQQEAARLKADEEHYTRLKDAEAGKAAAEMQAEERLILAEAEKEAAEKESLGKKAMAEGISAESAAEGLAEADVIRAQGDAEATSITAKADAMKLFDDVGREHEEFKLSLDKQREIELAEIEMQRELAMEQAEVLSEALKSANIDIVGGDGQFFDQITGSIARGKSVDRMVENSRTLTDVKDTFFNGDPDYFRGQLSGWIEQFGVGSEDVKNLSIAALLTKLIKEAPEGGDRMDMERMLQMAKRHGVAHEKMEGLLNMVS
ncbi:MAG: flotillin family protein [Verrucomicrobiota bacterium]